MFMSKFETQTYAILRIIAGFLFLWYGSMKLFNYPPAPEGMEMPGFIRYVAGSIEFFGGALIMAGLFTRPAAFLSSGLMAFAYWMGHGTKAVLPIQNHGELAVIFCFVFLYLSARGSGKWSLDGLRKKA